MNEYTAETLANRDEPIPVLSGPSESSNEGANGEGSKPKKLSPAYLKEKWHEVKADRNDAAPDVGAVVSIQDRLVAKIVQQILPLQDAPDPEDQSGFAQASATYERPAFSLPLMANNFRRFNARIGIAFYCQNALMKLFTWRRPIQTISFLLMYSFVCLDPYLLVVLPFAIVLLFIMVPAFLVRHPPPPPSASTSSTTAYYSYAGPALAPAKTIKPAPETSKDFFRNMRDLQNSMADFSNLHDAMVASVSPATNFSNEVLSSSTFLSFTVISIFLLLAAHYIPWGIVALIGGNAAIIVNHPAVPVILKTFKQDTGMVPVSTERTEAQSRDVTLFGVTLPLTADGVFARLKSGLSISLDAAPEEREVEIFELQHKTVSPYSAASEWESFIFTPTPYDPLSPAKIAGERPKGSRFFEDVRPPPGWAWKSKKWELDLDCREWVMERLITSVEFEVPHNVSGSEGIGEEIGGWVWDLPFHPPDEGLFRKADSLAYTGLSHSDPNTDASQHKGKNRKDNSANIDWKEDTKDVHGTGEWRRRRWIRVVQRVGVSVREKDPDAG